MVHHVMRIEETMKFGSGPNKSYSFGNGGWWSSTKPYSMDD